MVSVRYISIYSIGRLRYHWLRFLCKKNFSLTINLIYSSLQRNLYGPTFQVNLYLKGLYSVSFVGVGDFPCDDTGPRRGERVVYVCVVLF